MKATFFFTGQHQLLDLGDIVNETMSVNHTHDMCKTFTFVTLFTFVE